MTYPSRTTSTSTTAYVYTISGEAYDVPHEVGDPVPSEVPERKVREWLRAGVIERAKRAEEPAPPPVETPKPGLTEAGLVTGDSTSVPFTPAAPAPEFDPLAQPSTGLEVSPSMEPPDEGDEDGDDED